VVSIEIGNTTFILVSNQSTRNANSIYQESIQTVTLISLALILNYLICG
jgi:hypothetical protein